jgi:glycerol kinase
MSYVGSLDQGTSSTRFMVFDHAGSVVGAHQLEHQQILSQPGWVEHDPLEIWQRTQEVIAIALNKAGLQGSDLTAIGITNQRETALFGMWRPGDPWETQSSGKTLGRKTFLPPSPLPSAR